MNKTTKLAGLFTALVLILACNIPSGTSQQGEAGAALTAAAQTVQAQLTQPTQAQPSVTPTFTTSPGLPTNTVAPPTSIPSATQACDKADFVDENYPDDTVVAPGETFTKTWTFKNIGTCSWTPAYAIVFSSGNSMGGPATQALTSNVNPGQEVDLSVTLTAPAANGTYKGVWKLRNASGVVFVSQFWVQVKVASSSSGYDLHTRAPEADWKSAAGNLTFGGPDTNADGFAMYRDDQLLEDGSTPNKVLEMHPQWVDDGVITGLYPQYTVVSGDQFTAKIGFLAKNDGSCGVGNAKFQLNYREAGTLHPLDEWTETCDGSLRSVNVNLDSIAGHTVRFALAVMANGSAGQDWAVWVRPQVAP